MSDESLTIDLVDGCSGSVPLARHPRLTHAMPTDRNNWRQIGRGEGIHWLDLDEDISVVFGVKEYYRDEYSIRCRDLDRTTSSRSSSTPRRPGRRWESCPSGFGWSRRRISDQAVDAATSAGGRLLRRGEFAPGFPFAYTADPDGYEIEIWYE